MKPLILLLALISVSFTGSADPEIPLASELLVNMAKATRQLNYDGTFVFQQHGNMNSMRIVHKVEQEHEYERLIALTGTPREIIRDNDNVTCIFPDKKSVMMERSHPQSIFPKLSESEINILKKSYILKTVGQDRVAQRPVWVVDIRPQDAFRYGYRFWLDTETHFLLRANTLDTKGNILEHIMFTNISFPDTIDDAELVPTLSSDGYVLKMTPDKMGETVASSRWKMQWLPEGFEMQQQRWQPMVLSSLPVEHYSYSDSLASLSVFIEKLGKEQVPMNGFTRIGALVTYSILLNDHQITVVGEVPPITVKRVAESIGNF